MSLSSASGCVVCDVHHVSDHHIIVQYIISCARALRRHKVPKKEPEISAKVVSSLVCMEILDTDVGAVHMMY